MSVMGGEEFLEIKNKLAFLSAIPVYVMSSSQSEEAHQTAKRLGALDFLPKPFSIFTFDKIMGANVSY